MGTTEQHFLTFKRNIIGHDTVIDLPYGRKKLTNEELIFITNAVRLIADNINKWEKDYTYCQYNNELVHNSYPQKKMADFTSWFNI